MMVKHEDQKPMDENLPGAGIVMVAFEKLFGGGRGVEIFARTGLRYVKLDDNAILVEQNPKTKSQWADLANAGHRVAWVIRDRKYLARVLDGEVLMLK